MPPVHVVPVPPLHVFCVFGSPKPLYVAVSLTVAALLVSVASVVRPMASRVVRRRRARAGRAEERAEPEAERDAPSRRLMIPHILVDIPQVS